MGNYLWVGLGSALGGMARYWTAAAVASVAGAGFPWGTILINVAGSFVIGLYATLTISDGRLEAWSDSRAFVMVGICGGFTTFSSFSLQTLELLREDRWGAAAGNVLLSVIVCLAAVTAGHLLAVTLNR